MSKNRPDGKMPSINVSKHESGESQKIQAKADKTKPRKQVSISADPTHVQPKNLKNGKDKRSKFKKEGRVHSYDSNGPLKIPGYN